MGDERDDPKRQARVLRLMAARLDGTGRGESPLPSDVFAALEQELELALDDQAIREAWNEQGDEEREPWVFARSRIAG